LPLKSEWGLENADPTGESGGGAREPKTGRWPTCRYRSAAVKLKCLSYQGILDSTVRISSVRSHTVPRFLLDQFAYDDPVTGSRRLWQYSRDREPWWKASPSTATRFDHHFQDPNDPTREERLEIRLNQEIENPVHRFLPELRFGDLFPWQPHYVRSLTRYITLLFNRSRNRKGATREHAQIQVESLRMLIANEDQIARIAARWTIEQVNRGMPPDRAVVTAEEVRLRLNETIELIQTEHHIQTTYVDAMERALAFLDNNLANGQWGIVTTTRDDPFIIGDAPVVTWIRDRGLLHYGFGLERPNVEIILPVAPTACLHVLPLVPRNQQPLKPAVTEVNEAQASFASQYCYAHTNSQILNDLIRPRVGTRRIGVHLFSVRDRDYSNTMFELLMSGGSRFRAPRR
jgi:hypothetical protein